MYNFQGYFSRTLNFNLQDFPASRWYFRTFHVLKFSRKNPELSRRRGPQHTSSARQPPPHLSCPAAETSVCSAVHRRWCRGFPMTSSVLTMTTQKCQFKKWRTESTQSRHTVVPSRKHQHSTTPLTESPKSTSSGCKGQVGVAFRQVGGGFRRKGCGF